jgi:LmbE family N-acetylglucosaminyl deacetylase
LFIALIVTACLGYASYFRRYMVLPQSAINILQGMPLLDNSSRVLVFAPHCDDETLGAGGLIQQALSLDAAVRVNVVTDCNYHKNGEVRRQESVKATSLLGLKSSDIKFLNFPERDENITIDSIERSDILKAIKGSISDFAPTMVVIPHPNDTHIDHSSIAKIAEEAIGDNKDVTVAYYLIHYNFLRFPSPSGLRPSDYLLPPAVLINFTDLWYKLPLTQEQEDKKENAIAEYRSQLRATNPVLYRILFDFVRKNELFMIRSK